MLVIFIVIFRAVCGIPYKIRQRLFFSQSHGIGTNLGLQKNNQPWDWDQPGTTKTTHTGTGTNPGLQKGTHSGTGTNLRQPKNTQESQISGTLCVIYDHVCQLTLTGYNSQTVRSILGPILDQYIFGLVTGGPQRQQVLFSSFGSFFVKDIFF